MSTSHDRAQKRYRARQKNDTVADAMGWEHTDIVSVYVRPDGVHIAMDSSSKRVPLLSEQFVKVDAPELVPVEAQPAKPRVYAPKSWDADKWNGNIKIIREQAMTKQQVLDSWAEIAQKQNTPDAHKRVKHATAVVNALPDTPDWYELLPLADEG